MKILKTALYILYSLFDFSSVYLTEENVSELRKELFRLNTEEHKYFFFFFNTIMKEMNLIIGQQEVNEYLNIKKVS